MENVDILGKTLGIILWITWGNRCGLAWKTVYNR